MTYSELREKVEQQIAQLPLERLFLVSSFIDSIETKDDENNKKAIDLLRHVETWQGDDLADS